MGTVTEREKLERAGTLHWFHWFVVILSLILTISAWYFAKSQVEEKISLRFGRQADQIVELVSERMEKYEDALWGGVAFIRTSGGEIDYDEWMQYANSIRIELKYPGINGIGVVSAIQPEDLPSFLERQRERRPDYHVHPPHDGIEYYPISYIEPLKGNERAVGLDMAHETNRYTAAKRARDTGDARITGPIVLVQDALKTPGFLFYAPYYEDGTYSSVEERRRHFLGMVYAPFVVTKLMEGVLAKQKRHVGLRIADEQNVLYDELVASEEDFDPDPLLKRSLIVSLYGRNWTFDIWSTKSFRTAAASDQPIVILIGGIIIDTLLIALFVSISRSSRNALVYADAMNSELQLKTDNLETSNRDLQQFAYLASHDLQEPLRMVSSYVQLLAKRYKGKLDADADDFIGYATEGATRMKTLIDGILTFSQVGDQGADFVSVNCEKLLDDTLATLQGNIDQANVVVTNDSLPTIRGNAVQLQQLFQNLIGNAIKFRGESPPRIHVAAERQGTAWLFAVSDNGIGMEPEETDRIFAIFQRLHTRAKYSGTGIGLALCRRIVENHGGSISVASKPGKGSTFSFTIAA